MGATYRADVVIVGGGLAGLVTALELLDAGRSVALLEAGPRDGLGGLARWSFGGIFLVDTPEQRRGGIRDSPDLALQDWLRYGELGADARWGRAWAEAYTAGCREHVYDWLREAGIGFFPVVHWVERGLRVPGNSVPRFHMVWGTGSRLVEVLRRRLDEHPAAERLLTLTHHRVEEIVRDGGRVTGVAGRVSKPAAGDADGVQVPSGEFRAEADVVVVATGGICGDLAQVRARWPDDLGRAPEELLNGAHPAADGALHAAVERVGGHVTDLDRVWLYAAGVRHWRPRHEHHGLSLVPGKSALWLDWRGRRLQPPGVGGYDTRQLVESVCRQRRQHSWQLLNLRIARRELAVSGSELNHSIRERRVLRFLHELLRGNRALVREFLDNCPDFVRAGSLPELVERMHVLDGTDDVQLETVAEEVGRYDATVRRGRRFHNDPQLRLIAQARSYRGDRVRTCRAASIDDPRSRPLIAIRQRITTRKSLGGIRTDLDSRVLDAGGEPIAGLFAVGEAAGFGGGGMHGRRSLEGTFLGGCVLTARHAARAIAGRPR